MGGPTPAHGGRLRLGPVGLVENSFFVILSSLSRSILSSVLKSALQTQVVPVAQHTEEDLVCQEALEQEVEEPLGLRASTKDPHLLTDQVMDHLLLETS